MNAGWQATLTVPGVPERQYDFSSVGVALELPFVNNISRPAFGSDCCQRDWCSTAAADYAAAATQSQYNFRNLRNLAGRSGRDRW